MSDENIDAVVSDMVAKRNSRGEVGVATPALTIKQLWRASNSDLSLKAFARKLMAEGNVDAKRWMENKLGMYEAKRSDANVARVQLEKSATKLSRKKAKK